MATRVLIATPHTRPFYGEFVDSLMNLHKPPPTVFARVEGFAIDVGRNHLAEYFLRHPLEFTHILWIDSDATFAADSLTRLLSRDLDFVAGCMYHRALPPMPTMGVYVGKRKDGVEVFRFGPAIKKVLEHTKKFDMTDIQHQNALVLPKHGEDIWEIGGCGMHFTLIKREVYEALTPPYYLMNEGAAGEDFYFCLKARKAGFKIHNDLSVHTGHLLGPGKDVGLMELMAWTKNVVAIDDDWSRFDMAEEVEVGAWES